MDDVSKIIKEAIEVSIGGNVYSHSKVNQWTTNVVESCLGNLVKLQKPYKYIGTVHFFYSLNFNLSLCKLKINFLQ